MKEEIVEEKGKRYKKVRKGEYYDKKKSRKMKKHHPVRWILIGAFCLLVVAPVGFIFGAFYDPNTKEIAETKEEFTDMFSAKLSQGLTNIAKDNKLVIELDNDFLDSTLVVAQEKIASNETLKNFIKKIYCNIDGENYDFIVDVQLSFFKTRLHLSTLMSLNEETNTYIFKIKDVVVGRLPLGNLAKSIIPNFLSESQINEAIHAIPLNANFSLSNLEITYKRDDLKTDIYNLLNKINLNIMDSPLSSVLLGIYDKLDSYATFKDKITMVMDFSNFQKPFIEIRNKIDDVFKEHEATYASIVTEMMNNKLISKDEGGKIFKFFLTGISDDAQKIFDAKPEAATACLNYIKKVDSQKLEDVKDYKGESKYTASKIDKDNITSAITGLPDKAITDPASINIDLKIKEDALSKFLRSTPMMCYTFDMPLESNGTYIYNYVSFDDFSTNIEKDKMNIFGCINLNGVQLPLTICSDVASISGTNRKLEIKPSDVYLSFIPLTDTVKDNLFEYISSGLTSEDDLFSFNKESKAFVFDLSAIEIKSGVDGVKEVVDGIMSGKDFKLKTIDVPISNIDFSCSAVIDSTTEKGMLEIKAEYKA